MQYPKELLRNIYWSFNYGPVENRQKFEEAVKTYHYKVSGQEFPFDLNEEILPFAKVVIQYMKYDEEEEDWDEPQILLEAENGKSFTAGELLYKIHQTAGKALEGDDNVYFEGISFATDQDPDFPGIPVYFLDTGT